MGGRLAVGGAGVKFIYPQTIQNNTKQEINDTCQRVSEILHYNVALSCEILEVVLRFLALPEQRQHLHQIKWVHVDYGK